MSESNSTPGEHTIQFFTADEWTAVYLDGKLVRVGDSYLASEWLEEHFGVKHEYDDVFLRGGSSREDVAETIEELEAFRAQREARKAEAERLRAQAKALLAQADLVESSRSPDVRGTSRSRGGPS